MTGLEAIIHDLMDAGKEGDYWDFKAAHHETPGDLIKDIICLANVTAHKGDRYLVFGVDDDAAVRGLKPGSLKKQADIADTLRRAGFAGDKFPDVYLEDLFIDGKQIQVLIIKDLPEKPYYLQKEYNRKGTRLHAGTIYTRVRDSNQIAPAPDIESMWRERLGLDCPPLERMKAYLLDFDGWTRMPESEYSRYYNNFPEFTVREEDSREVQGGENWVRAAMNPNAYVAPMKLLFHQTALATIHCIYYDEMQEITPAPGPCFDPDNEDLYFYSIDADTLDFILLQFLRKQDRFTLLRDGLKMSRSGRAAPFIIFESSEERKRFIDEIRSNPIVVDESHTFTGSPMDSAIISDQDRNIITYSRAVIERYDNWKAGEGT